MFSTIRANKYFTAEWNEDISSALFIIIFTHNKVSIHVCQMQISERESLQRRQ